MGNVQDTANSQDSPFSPTDPSRNRSPSQPSAYPTITDTSGDHDYEIILPGYPNPNPNPGYTPTRPAPGPPPAPVPATANAGGYCNTLGHYAALEGVPFVLNPKLTSSGNNSGLNGLPVVKVRTLNQLDREYHYDFRAERQS